MAALFPTTQLLCLNPRNVPHPVSYPSINKAVQTYYEATLNEVETCEVDIKNYFLNYENDEDFKSPIRLARDVNLRHTKLLRCVRNHADDLHIRVGFPGTLLPGLRQNHKRMADMGADDNDIFSLVGNYIHETEHAIDQLNRFSCFGGWDTEYEENGNDVDVVKEYRVLVTKMNEYWSLFNKQYTLYEGTTIGVDIVKEFRQGVTSIDCWWFVFNKKYKKKSGVSETLND